MRADVIGQSNIVHELQVIFGIDVRPLDDEAAQRGAVLIVITLPEFTGLVLRQMQILDQIAIDADADLLHQAGAARIQRLVEIEDEVFEHASVPREA